jgi:hypothetical protein
MPKSMEELIQHADDISEMFENWDSSKSTILSKEETAILRAVYQRCFQEKKIADAVQNARAKNISWKDIGFVLGTSAQSAHRKYSAYLSHEA